MLFTLRRTLSYSEFSDGICEQGRSLQWTALGPVAVKSLPCATCGAALRVRRGRDGSGGGGGAAGCGRGRRLLRQLFQWLQLSKFNVGLRGCIFVTEHFETCLYVQKPSNRVKTDCQTSKSNTQGFMVHVSLQALFSMEQSEEWHSLKILNPLESVSKYA